VIKPVQTDWRGGRRSVSLFGYVLSGVLTHFVRVSGVSILITHMAFEENWRYDLAVNRSWHGCIDPPLDQESNEVMGESWLVVVLIEISSLYPRQNNKTIWDFEVHWMKLCITHWCGGIEGRYSITCQTGKYRKGQSNAIGEVLYILISLGKLERKKCLYWFWCKT